ncbi:hypothetical protein UR09_00040 [Candidatus Nitromaritima sp. SCGC AAA799-A02]|nr:hypothetical protein UR09_00040 [Candidatus Nitromaritima sp. SCGC AAA799-A02]
MDTKNFELYQKMYLIRMSEENIRVHYPSDELKTPVHLCIGQEAIAAGTTYALKPEDQIFGTYRNHGIYLSRTGETDPFFGELFGKATGEFRGKAGSMHLSAPNAGFLATSAVVGTTIPVAAGSAFVNKHTKNDRLVAVYFGEGALDEGVFWESLNFSSLKKLPILFICEDNDLAIHSKASDRQGYRSITDVVSQFDCHVLQSESTDPEVIADLSAKGIEWLRDKGGPVFMHLKYYRYLEHVGINEDFHFGYRSKEEFLKWHEIDPVNLQRQKLIKKGYEESVIQKMEQSVVKQIQLSIEKARNAPFPAGDELFKDIFA